VSLPLARSVDAVTVPFSAIVQQGGEEYVYTVEDNVARRLSVRTGIVSGDRIEIERGVQTGQSVVVSGIQELRPGRPVTVSEDE
jgi:membrane fusion protein (multidrug efflux system)